MARRGDHAEQPMPPTFRITMPCRWSEGGLPGFAGRVRLRRTFGYPGRLDAYERVWVTFAGVGGAAEACLNDHPLGHIVTASEFEVTRWLRQRNELVVDMDGTAEEGGMWGEVALEVRCTAFLCDLRRSAILRGERMEWRVSGRVMGEAERPLEVYVLLDRSVVGYQVVKATAEGQFFEILGSTPWNQSPSRGHTVPVQVDLVNGAVVWYSSGEDVPVETESDQDR